MISLSESIKKNIAILFRTLVFHDNELHIAFISILTAQN